jgi:NitT/TauT family transport system permease protein/taurine transport system permease protein/sulfonate transport system permease protein
LRKRAPASGGSGRIGVVVVLVGLALWSLAAVWVSRTSDRADVLLPSPIDVVRSIPGLAIFAGPRAELTYSNAVRTIFGNTVASGTRLAAGLTLGAFVGIGAGLLLGWSRRLRYLIEGPLLVVRVVPLLALLPLFLAWFGGRDVGAVSFIAYAVFAMLFVATLEAIRNVDPVTKDYARTLGASQAHVYRTVVVPAIVPELTGSVRVVLGVAWAILLAAEFLASQDGIGHILILAQQYSYTDRMILIVLLIMAYTFLLDRAFALLAARVTRWVPR